MYKRQSCLCAWPQVVCTFRTGLPCSTLGEPSEARARVHFSGKVAAEQTEGEVRTKSQEGKQIDKDAGRQRSVLCLEPETARPPWSREALSERCKPLVAERKGRKPARGAVGRRCVQDASARQVEMWAGQGLNPERSDGPKALRTSAGACSRQLENPTAALSSVTHA